MMKKIYIYINVLMLLIFNSLFSQSNCNLHLRENFFNEEIGLVLVNQIGNVFKQRALKTDGIW